MSKLESIQEILAHVPDEMLEGWGKTFGATFVSAVYHACVMQAKGVLGELGNERDGLAVVWRKPKEFKKLLESGKKKISLNEHSYVFQSDLSGMGKRMIESLVEDEFKQQKSKSVVTKRRTLPALLMI